MRAFKISEDGLDHLKRFEGYRPFTYDDFAPDVPFEDGGLARGTLTIGYGHTGAAAVAGNVLEDGEGEMLLGEDIAWVADAIDAHVRADLDQGQYDALSGFIFNIGASNFRRSTLLRKLNAGDVDGAAMEFQRWVYSKGVKLEGLVIRRSAEAAMFSGAARFGFGPDDVAELARRGEEILGIGSATRPDAVEDRGIQKSPLKSKTIQASALGFSAAAISAVASMFEAMDWRVQLLTSLWMGGCALYLVANRMREFRAGEH